jgi:hypothetical protein
MDEVIALYDFSNCEVVITGCETLMKTEYIFLTVHKDCHSPWGQLG